MKTHDASSPPVSSTGSRCTSLAETSGSVADRSSDPKAAIVQGHAIEQARISPAETYGFAASRSSDPKAAIVQGHAIERVRMTPAERQVWEAHAAARVHPALAVPLV